MMTNDAQRLFVATAVDIWGMYLEVSALHTKIPATASIQHLWILSNIGTKLWLYPEQNGEAKASPLIYPLITSLN
jgi:hypothetical protein